MVTSKQALARLRRLTPILACVGPFLALPARADPDESAQAPDPAKQSKSLPIGNQLFLSQLTFYERNYFIMGFTDRSQAKFQLSLKYNLYPNESPHGVYVGYTQLSLWNVYEHSGPFTEIDFSPILFHEYRVQPRVTPVEGYCGASFSRLGLDHSSNGAGGRASRAFNRVSATTAFGCYGAETQHLEVKLQVWPPLIFDSENEDMEAFIGYGEITLAASTAQRGRWYGQLDVATRLRKGAHSAARRGAWIVDAAWNPYYGPASDRVWRFTPYLFAQFFTGYAESLSTYNFMQTHFRVGIGLTDGAGTR